MNNKERRKEILETINEELENEDAARIDEKQIIYESEGLDSFGISMVMFALDEKYGCFPMEEDGEEPIDFNTVTASDLIDIIISSQDSKRKS